MTECSCCLNDEVLVTDYHGSMLCNDCIKVEQETDWDDFEEKKRRRIAEENEY